MMPDAYLRMIRADSARAAGGACEQIRVIDAGRREHYADAALYDFEYRRRRDDVRFYRELARETLGASGRVLELACGSGRITVALLRAGHEVLGVDLSGAMLTRARARVRRLGRASRARCALVRADMRAIALGARFPLIVMAFNAFEHLYTREDVFACLSRVRAHLLPGGVFAFDVQNPDLEWLCRDPALRWEHTRFRHPTTGEHMVYTTNHDYDPISQIAVIRLFYDPEGAGVDVAGVAESPAPAPAGEAASKVVMLSQRKFFPAELEGIVLAHGFRVLARYGGFAREPLEGPSESQVLVCTRG